MMAVTVLQISVQPVCRESSDLMYVVLHNRSVQKHGRVSVRSLPGLIRVSYEGARGRSRRKEKGSNEHSRRAKTLNIRQWSAQMIEKSVDP